MDEIRSLSAIDPLFAYRLMRVSYLYQRRASVVYQERGGLSVSQWKILALIQRRGPIQAVELVRRSTLDKGAVSRVTRSLWERKLIHREFGDVDARRINLVVTEEGRRIYHEVQTHLREIHATLFTNTRTEDQAVFFSVLQNVEKELIEYLDPETTQE